MARGGGRDRAVGGNEREVITDLLRENEALTKEAVGLRVDNEALAAKVVALTEAQSAPSTGENSSQGAVGAQVFRPWIPLHPPPEGYLILKSMKKRNVLGLYREPWEVFAGRFGLETTSPQNPQDIYLRRVKGIEEAIHWWVQEEKRSLPIPVRI